MGGFPIPEPFVWDDSFKVFYDTIDGEHKSLFQAIWSVCDNPASQLALDNAYAVFNYHFTHEEGVMNASHYDGYKAHKQVHDKFLNDFKSKGHAPVDKAFMDWSKDWLVNHIKTVDFKYKGKLSSYP